MFFFENVAPVEMVFIENYNNIATLLNLPLYQKDVFLQRIKEQGDRSYYNHRPYFISNRAELFAVNPHITALVKNTTRTQKMFLKEVSRIAPVILSQKFSATQIEMNPSGSEKSAKALFIFM